MDETAIVRASGFQSLRADLGKLVAVLARLAPSLPGART